MTEANSEHRRIYVVGNSNEYTNWMEGVITKHLENATLVLFTGGEDVDPGLYDEPIHPRTGFNRTRDNKEVEVFNKAQELGIKCIGICRGSQFLCVMSGGKLVQHQENPLFVHNIETFDGKVIPITSTHHQAQYPYVLPSDSYKLLAWSKGISNVHEDGNQKELPLPNNKEAEIVYYKHTDCLAIQGHPEMMVRHGDKFSLSLNYLKLLLTKFMLGSLKETIKPISQTV